MGNYERAENILDKYSRGNLSASEAQKALKSFGYKADLRGKSNVIPVFPLDGGDGFDVELAKGGLAKQMELFEPVERGFQSGGDVAIAEMSAKEKILQKMRENKNKRLSRNEQYAIDRRKQMESMLTEADRKKQERSRQFAVMTEMLETGAIAKFTESQKADFMKLYNMMKQTQGMAEGGLLDEGGMIDEESGNDVPPGSLRSEVRDDIPAQLSEGEFVFPADVVRYIGLEKLMMMRQEAKQGLAQMEAMGQMGNSEEAVMPDNLPFDMYDLDIEDDGVYNMQSGGYVPPTQQPGVVDPITGTVKMPTTPRQPVVPASASVDAGYTKYVAPPPPTTTPSTSSLFYTTAEDTTNLPGFEDLLGKDLGEYDEFRTYINDAGQTMQIPFKDGQPLYPIPEGFYPKPDEPDMTDLPEEPTLVDSTLMLENDRGEGFESGDFGGPGESRSSAEDAVMGMISKAHGFNVHTMQQEQLTPFEMMTQPLGIVRGLIQEYQINKEIDTMIDSIATGKTTVDDIMNAVKEMAQEVEDGIRDPETGEIDTAKSFESKFGQAQMDYKGYYGEDMDSTEGPGKSQTPSDVDQQGHPGLSGSPSDSGSVGPGGMTGNEGFGGGPGSGPGDAAAPLCLTENMKVKLNGVIDYVTNVNVGDIVGDSVVVEVMHKHMRNGYYVVNGELEITNDHPVLANGSWKRTEDLVLGDYINDVEVTSLEYVDQVTPTVYIGTADDRYDVYTEGEVYTVHGQYKNITKQAA